jgi:hypothetical protein
VSRSPDKLHANAARLVKDAMFSRAFVQQLGLKLHLDAGIISHLLKRSMQRRVNIQVKQTGTYTYQDYSEPDPLGQFGKQLFAGFFKFVIYIIFIAIIVAI